MRLPFDGDYPLTQKWNDSRYRSSYTQFGLLGHNGMDWGLPPRTPIVSPHNGIIKEKADEGSSGYGRYVKVESADEGSVLAHFDEVIVNLNDPVGEGQVLGYSGNTGFSTGPHLHWGYYRVRTRDRDNGLGGTIPQTDWLDFKVPLPDKDHQTSYQILEDYRKNRVEGPEGNFEGFTRTLVERDHKWLQLQTDLGNCQTALSAEATKPCDAPISADNDKGSIVDRLITLLQQIIAKL